MQTNLNLKTLFDEYNKRHFNNEISIPVDVEIFTRKVKYAAGFFNYPKCYHTVDSFGNTKKITKENAKIVIYTNSPFMKTDNDLKETLLHEMVHAHLFQCFGKEKCGHTPTFKMRLKRILRDEFNLEDISNVRFKQNVDKKEDWLTVPLPTPLQTKEVSVSDIMPSIYHVKSLNKTGKFLNESSSFGIKFISLEIPGYLFPFRTAIDNVEKIS